MVSAHWRVVSILLGFTMDRLCSDGQLLHRYSRNKASRGSSIRCIKPLETGRQLIYFNIPWLGALV